MWPWPWTNMVKTWVMLIPLMRWTCDPSFMKILQAVLEIWNGHKIKSQSIDLQMWPWPWTVMVKTCVLPIPLMRWKCDPSLMNFFKPYWRYVADTKSVMDGVKDGRTVYLTSVLGSIDIRGPETKPRLMWDWVEDVSWTSSWNSFNKHRNCCVFFCWLWLGCPNSK